jgi:hypothetical protein
MAFGFGRRPSVERTNERTDTGAIPRYRIEDRPGDNGGDLRA